MLRQVESFLENLIFLSDFVGTQIKDMHMKSKTLPNGSVQPRINNGSRYYYHCTYVDAKLIQRYLSSDEVAMIAGLTQKRLSLEHSLKYWHRIQSLLSSRFTNKCIALLGELKRLQDKTNEKIQTTISFLDGEEKQLFFKAAGRSFPKLQGGETIRLHKSNDTLLYTSDSPPKYGAGDIETSENDISVRSKSELIIFEQLKAKGLDYYFEQGIVFDNHVFHPDFLIRHPVSKEFLIWEHCGLMTNDNYFQNWMKKLAMYAKYGIRPCENLILTYEDANTAFSIKHIQDVINFYFT